MNTSTITTTCLQKNAEVITQKVRDETVLFDMSTGHYYSLNEIGACAWELLDGNRNLNEVAQLLAAEYEAPEEVILEDIQSLVDHLCADGLLLEPKG